MIKYEIPNSVQYIVIADNVLQTFLEYKQTDNSPERGGVLFAEFDFPQILISDISLPNQKDIQKRFLFIPNKRHQQQIIFSQFKKGLHFVGEWHTHPQNHPNPSQLDIESMQDSFQKSEHELNYFVLLILGLSDDLEAIWISLHNSDSYVKLNPIQNNQ